MQEQWIRWEPLKELKGKYDVKVLIANHQGLTITLEPFHKGSQNVEIVFDRFVEAYRQTDESCRISLIHDLSKIYSGEFYANWTFFQSVNSKYLIWLADESGGWSEVLKLTHFCLICDDSVVDIAANYDPVVRFID